MIAIPNMEKPKGCKECKFCIVEAKVEGKIYPLHAYCFVQHQNIKDFTDCPLIEIDLVRCGECEHWNDEDHWCNIRDSYGWDYKPTDFCSYGERRADE